MQTGTASVDFFVNHYSHVLNPLRLVIAINVCVSGLTESSGTSFGNLQAVVSTLLLGEGIYSDRSTAHIEHFIKYIDI